MVRVCLPGTGGMLPLPERWLACCYIEHQGRALLVDCGEGTQIALKKADCPPAKIDMLLLSHYHADHVSGLPGLLLALANGGKTSQLTIVGPGGLGEVVRALTVITPALSYPLLLHELQGTGEEAIQWGEGKVEALALDHNVPCYGYRVTFFRKAVFCPEKAEQYGVPLPLRRTLHAGVPVVLEDGRRITPDMVTGAIRPPVRICYITDTRPVDGIAEFACGSDLFVCEGMYADEDMREKMQEKGHMLFSDGAHYAAKAGVRRLWLTHFSPALVRPAQFLEKATGIFSSSEVSYDGKSMVFPEK